MASVFSSEDVTCCVCLSIFTDPVTLPCGHSYCRLCITDVLQSEAQCPQCRTPVPTEGPRLTTSHVLKSLSEKAREAETRKAGGGRSEAAEFCPEHEEKLKLFCVTDQQLACIICRDGDKHEGHKFKPVKEAAAWIRKELQLVMENIGADVLAAAGLANTQRDEMRKTTKKSEQLRSQIHVQFEEMHQFLRKREDEIKTELKHKETEAVEQMSQSLDAMETALSEVRELDVRVRSVLEVQDPEEFLRSWTQGPTLRTPEDLFRPRVSKLRVVDSSLCLGPYESHLQFFMWKEMMIQVIEPRAERLTLRSSSPDVTVSEDGRSLTITPLTIKPPASFHGASSFGQTFSQAPSMFGNTRGFSQTFSGFGGTPSFSQHSSGFGSKEQHKAFAFQTSGSGSADYDRRQSRDEASDPVLSNEAFSVNAFCSGQHYWEIEVGHGKNWAVGIKDHVLKYDGSKYSIHSPTVTTDVAPTNRLWRVGIYINCSSQRLSFYDADGMSHIHSVSFAVTAEQVSAYFTFSGSDSNSVTVCWY